MESLQERYGKWILELERCTPEYIIREELKMDKNRVQTGKRAMSFESRAIAEEKKGLLRGSVLEGIRMDERRERYLRRCGWSASVCEMRRESRLDVGMFLEEKDRKVQLQERRGRIDGSKYGIEYKYGMVDIGLPKYIRESMRGKRVKDVARLRCGGFMEGQ